MNQVRRALGLALIAAMPLGAADKWIRLATPNFELYTNTSEATGTETIRQCEQLRSFFVQLPEYQQGQLSPVRVVQFSSTEQFAPYKATDWEAGHYESNGNRDWIALGPGSSPAERATTLAHEYHHLVAARAGMRLPPWLREGLADFYSTLKPVGDKTQVGALIPARLHALKRGGWLSVEALTSIDEKSFRAMKGEEAPLFYAEGWILTHLMATAPEYAPKFPKLVAALNQGRSSRDAFQLAFGRSSEDIEKDLREYLGQETKSALLFPERVDAASSADISVAATTDFEVSLVMTDLLAVMEKEDSAKAAFDSLNRQFAALQEIRNAPDGRAAPLAAMYFHLARIGWNPKQATDQTLVTLESILDLPQVRRVEASQVPSTAEVYYQFALVAQEAKAPREKVRTAFLRALELQPEHLDARVKLGEFYLEGNELSAAESTFVQIPATSKAAGYALNGLYGVAAEYVNAGSFTEALQEVEKGRKWIRTLSDTASTNKLLVYIGERSADFYLQSGDLAQAQASLDRVKTLPISTGEQEVIDRLRGLIDARSKGKYAVRRGEKLLHAEGTAIALDCPAAGPLLRVKTDGKEMRFDLPDPAAVEVSSSGAEAVDLRCGPLKPFRIAVEYVSPGVTNPASSGIIRKMAF